MKIKEQVGHQGDVQWYAVDAIPEGAEKMEKQFIAASEKSGHVHALSGNYDMYKHNDGFVIDVKEDCVLNHTDASLLNAMAWQKPQVLPEKDHHPSTIKKGVYYVGIQRKFNPVEKIFEKVKD